MINKEKEKIQEEAVNLLAKADYRGIVILPTGTGKTLVLINCLQALYKPGMRVLYTCDSQKLRDEGFKAELDKWGAGHLDDKIEKCCYAGAYKKENEEYDILLADEGDYGLTQEYSKLFTNNKFKYIIFVSATLEAKKRKLAKSIAPIVYEKKIKEIEDKKVVNKANFFLVPYLLNQLENRQYVEYNEKFSKMLSAKRAARNAVESQKLDKALEFLTLSRIHFLAKLDSSAYICKKLLDYLDAEHPESRVIIFCGLTEQADRVCTHSYHTGNEKEDHLGMFERGEINKIAVCGKINRGINVKGVNKMILENYNRSETLLIQRTGRGRRLEVDDTLDIYIPIPYFKKYRRGELVTVPTIMQDWLMQAGKNLGIENAKTIYLK